MRKILSVIKNFIREEILMLCPIEPPVTDPAELKRREYKRLVDEYNISVHLYKSVQKKLDALDFWGAPRYSNCDLNRKFKYREKIWALGDARNNLLKWIKENPILANEIRPDIIIENFPNVRSLHGRYSGAFGESSKME